MSEEEVVSDITVPEYTEERLAISSIMRDGKGTNYRAHSPEEVQALSEDIDAHGLLTPPWVVRDRSGAVYLAAGEARVQALSMLGQEDVSVRVYPASLYGSVSKTIALLRAIENSRKEVTFADRVRSIRQLTTSRLSKSDIAKAWRVHEDYVGMIIRWDARLPPGWELKLTKNQADRIASADNPAEAYAAFLSDGTMPAASSKPKRGRGLASSRLQAELYIRHPWAEGLFDLKDGLKDGPIKLTSSKHLAALDKLCSRLYEMVASGEIRPRQDA